MPQVSALQSPSGAPGSAVPLLCSCGSKGLTLHYLSRPWVFLSVSPLLHKPQSAETPLFSVLFTREEREHNANLPNRRAAWCLYLRFGGMLPYNSEPEGNMAIFFYRVDLHIVGRPTLIYRSSIHSINSSNKYSGGLGIFHMQ